MATKKAGIPAVTKRKTKNSSVGATTASTPAVPAPGPMPIMPGWPGSSSTHPIAVPLPLTTATTSAALQPQSVGFPPTTTVLPNPNQQLTFTHFAASTPAVRAPGPMPIMPGWPGSSSTHPIAVPLPLTTATTSAALQPQSFGFPPTTTVLPNPNQQLTFTQFAPMEITQPRACPWDPLRHKEPPTAAALRRIHKEVANIMKEPVEGIYFVQDDNEANVVHALVIGPSETPYEGGFFYFYIRLPPTYPFKPPLVKLMTTGSGLVRFNPNLYADGKVCLSILGTWAGPAWTPNLTIRTVLLSIQSLMCKDPYYNEPGYESNKGNPATQRAAADYNDQIRYETLRVAVLDMMDEANLESAHMPQVLKEKMKSVFVKNIDFYTAVILEKKYNQEAGAGGAGAAGGAGTYFNPLTLTTGPTYYQHDYGKLEERLGKLVERYQSGQSGGTGSVGSGQSGQSTGAVAGVNFNGEAPPPAKQANWGLGWGVWPFNK